MPALIREALIGGGLSDGEIEIVPDEAEAVERAVSEATPGDLIVYIADKPERAAEIVEATRRRTGTLACPSGPKDRQECLSSTEHADHRN